MATTAQLRTSYPEFIVQWPTATRNPVCSWATAATVTFLAGGPSYPTGRVNLKVHPATRQIWRAQAAVMLHYGYDFRETSGGTVSCRRITGGTNTTLHAHGIAKDDNPSSNGYRTAVGALDDPDTAHTEGLLQWGKYTDMPPAMVRAIEAIRLTNGARPFEWGGRWWNVKDPMHWELDVLQTGLAPVNLATLPPGAWTAYLAFEGGGTPRLGEDEEMLPLQYGDGYNPAPGDAHPSVAGQDRRHKVEDVRRHQDRLNKLGAGLTLDGLYGPATIAASKTIGGGWTGHPDGKEGRWWGGNQDGELDWTIALRASSAGTVDEEARSQAQTARTTADTALDAAIRANRTLDKIRSE